MKRTHFVYLAKYKVPDTENQAKVAEEESSKPNSTPKERS